MLSLTPLFPTLLLLLSCHLLPRVEGACPISTWGVACERACHCRYDTACDGATGACPAGCASDWRTGGDGTACSQRLCNQGRFGPPDCAGSCHCEDEGQCSARDGVCAGGGACEAGWWGLNCQEQETDNCQSCNITTDASCIPCSMEACFCKDPNCDLPDGECRRSDCSPGFAGPDCTHRACPEGKFGPTCEATCRCRDVHGCQGEDGLCPGGRCLDGWRGDTCSLPACPAHSFGYPECRRRCFCREKLPGTRGALCDDATGRCPDGGCQNGWTGPACNVSACPAGRWGPPGCRQSCHCRHNSGCNPVNGSCSHGGGCQAGWMDANCNNKIVALYARSDMQKAEKENKLHTVWFGVTSGVIVMIVVAGGILGFVRSSRRYASDRSVASRGDEQEMGSLLQGSGGGKGKQKANVHRTIAEMEITI